MKVSDIMRKQVDSVTSTAKVRDVARIIFGRGINGVPVCKEKKVIGFVTERDILAKFYPSMAEYMEDSAHVVDFEEMEQKHTEILSLPVEKIMSTNPITVTEKTPLLRAQSLMFVNSIGRLPVVDSDGKLVGIIAQGDIFRAVVAGKEPIEGEEEFFDWQAQYYDVYINWKARLENEIPSLTGIFRREKAKKILDIASSSGEHAIALAKEGFDVCGIEPSDLIARRGARKVNELPMKLQEKIKLRHGSYSDELSQLSDMYDAALFLGNGFTHVISTGETILQDVAKKLDPRKGFMVFQMINLDRLFAVKNGFREFVIRTSRQGYDHEHAFLVFYSKVKEKLVNYNFAAFDLSYNRWVFRGIRSTQIMHVDYKNLIQMLQKAGFSHVSLYGGDFYDPLFGKRFDPEKDDWLTVVAKR